MNFFLSRSNIDMLVEILLDDKPNKTQTDIQQIIQEINVFRNTQMNSSAITTMGLLELNQLFLTRMVGQQQGQQDVRQDVRQDGRQQGQQQQKYKVEDLKAERMDFFDQQLAQKRSEFESAITLKKPAIPNFEDKNRLDTPISDMGALLAQTMAQRNLDFSTMQQQTPQKHPNDWLSASSTSIKVEKEKEKDKEKDLVHYDHPTDNYNHPTDNYDHPTDKKITWQDTTTTTSIFSKLKQTQQITLESQVENLTNRIIVLENMMEAYLTNKDVISSFS